MSFNSVLGLFSFVIHQIHISPKQTIIRRAKQTKDWTNVSVKTMLNRRKKEKKEKRKERKKRKERRDLLFRDRISVTFLCKVKSQGEWTLGYLTRWGNCLHYFHWVTQWSIVCVCDRKRKDWTDKERAQTKKEKTQRTVKDRAIKVLSPEVKGQHHISHMTKTRKRRSGITPQPALSLQHSRNKAFWTVMNQLIERWLETCWNMSEYKL